MERSHGSEPVVIKTVENGPYQVKGPVRVLDHTGAEYELGPGRTQVLCRCGLSKDKPFCDGSHVRNQWVAEPADSDDSAGR
jgi:CDGSH-type Zn-finger protein